MLLTRAPAPGDGAEAALRALGADVETLPLIRVMPPDDPTPLRDAARRADEFAWIAFTSGNGVEAFARALDAAPPLRAKIAAIGDATARTVVRSLGREPDLVPGSFTGAALGAALAARLRDGEPVLIVQAADARGDLERALAHARPAPHVVAAYATVGLAPPQTAAAVARAAVIVLASGSAARSLAAALQPNPADALRDKTIACIGPVTAHEARAAGIPVTVVARASTMAGVVAAIAEHAGAP